MSWSPDLFIGEMRPWPDSVHVVRGKTDETRRYTPERKDAQEALERRIDELCAENERLHADQVHWELGNCPSCPNVADLQEALEENAKLREEVEQWHRLTAGIELPEYPITEFKPKDLERENAKLQEFAAKAWSLFIRHGAVHACDLSEVDAVRDGLRELGIEVPS